MHFVFVLIYSTIYTHFQYMQLALYNTKVSLQTRIMAPPIIGCGVPRIERRGLAEVVMRSEPRWRDAAELGEEFTFTEQRERKLVAL